MVLPQKYCSFVAEQRGMALREIGDENKTELQMNIIKGHLKNVPTGDFQKDILLAPAWVRKKMQQV